MYHNLPFRRVQPSDSTAVEEITILSDSEGDGGGGDDEVTVTKEATPTRSRSRGSWSRSRSRSRSPIKDDGAVFTHRSVDHLGKQIILEYRVIHTVRYMGWVDLDLEWSTLLPRQ